MMIFGHEREQVEITYPCQWIYTVIGEDCSLLKEAIADACGERSPQINHSQVSKGGKYHSLKVDVRVESEAARLGIYEKFKAAPAVKVIL